MPIAIAVFPVLGHVVSTAHMRVEAYYNIPWRASHQNSSTSNLAFLDHLQDHSRRLPGLFLAYQALRRCSWFQGIWVHPETADVGMRGDEVEPPQLPTL
jgi:hypothetical protein